jgi:hyaluronoglucosaminidase
MTEYFNRKPFLWDNYPVNDSVYLQGKLQIYSLTGRSYEISEYASGHAVNPMFLPNLSMISLATLNDIYCDGENYSPMRHIKKSLFSLCGDKLGKAIDDNISNFQIKRFSDYSEDTIKSLYDVFNKFIDDEQSYSEYQRGVANEIIGWLRWMKGKS